MQAPSSGFAERASSHSLGQGDGNRIAQDQSASPAPHEGRRSIAGA
ncbi:hypothetical protein PGZ78_08580 [Klebsiella pneumoniae]|nr:hypothetical protein [Klebsiella pneumoniae]